MGARLAGHVIPWRSRGNRIGHHISSESEGICREIHQETKTRFTILNFSNTEKPKVWLGEPNIEVAEEVRYVGCQEVAQSAISDLRDYSNDDPLCLGRIPTRCVNCLMRRGTDSPAIWVREYPGAKATGSAESARSSYRAVWERLGWRCPTPGRIWICDNPPSSSAIPQSRSPARENCPPRRVFPIDSGMA